MTPEKAQELLRQGAFGKIDTEIRWRDPQQAGDKQPLDYHPGQNPQRWELMRGEGCEKKFQELCQQVDAIDRSGTPYHPLGPNSNTTVTVACKNCGLDPKLPEKNCAPGAEKDIDPKNGSRPHGLNREMVMIVQHEQGRTGHAGSPAG